MNKAYRGLLSIGIVMSAYAQQPSTSLPSMAQKPNQENIAVPFSDAPPVYGAATVSAAMPQAAAYQSQEVAGAPDSDVALPAPTALPVDDKEGDISFSDVPPASVEQEAEATDFTVEEAAVPLQEPEADIPAIDQNSESFQRSLPSVAVTTPGAPVNAADTLGFNTDKKRQEVIALVERAVKEVQMQPLDIACNRFTHTKEFIHGDLYIFMYDIHGTCLAHGDDAYLLWQNKIDLTDWVGTPIVKQIIKKAQQGGGWVTYGWNNGTKVAYVRLVEKEGKSYVVGAGFFPHSKEETVVNLVKGGVALFNQVKKENQPIYWAFSRMSYPSGSFVAGNLYLYALDFHGKILAQGDRPGLINSNSWDYQDEKGLYVNREIIRRLENSNEGTWVEYISKRALKRAYAEKVVDKQGNKYFIACGYYPDADRNAVVNLVRKGYQFMKTSGKTNAVREFSQRSSDDYRYGDLYLVVYDMNGRIIADGSNADNIGRNMYAEVDQDKFPYIQKMIKRATKEGIWINAKIQGSFQSTYAQKVDLGITQFVIACSYYPVSKPETMMLLVQSGMSFLKANPREEAFAQFVKRDGSFRRGDLQLTVVDETGLCYAYGDDVDLIWRNIFDVKDEAGRPFIKMFINQVQQGPTVIKTKLNNAIKVNYVTSLEKDGKIYVLSSGYYQ
jgi:hypothetical protein